MARSRPVFHTLSYLQYPAVGIAGLFVIRALLSEREGMLDEMNTALVFIGLSVSLSTLQDTTTTQNEISRRVWTNPTLGRAFLTALGGATVLFIGFGLLGVVGATDGKLTQVSFGLVVLGIGMIGLLKVAGEMFEHHRSDRGPGAVDAADGERDGDDRK
ncbi:MAG: hypothetical protein AAFU73_16935 [Planctomycetota bacterium]